jgi:hypothetical protein
MDNLSFYHYGFFLTTPHHAQYTLQNTTTQHALTHQGTATTIVPQRSRRNDHATTITPQRSRLNDRASTIAPQRLSSPSNNHPVTKHLSLLP